VETVVSRHKRLGQNPIRFPNTLASAIAAFGVFLCLAGPSFGEEDMKTDPYENAVLVDVCIETALIRAKGASTKSTGSYDTDLADAAWASVAPVLPAARPGRATA
jgi:hypothetical protein